MFSVTWDSGILVIPVHVLNSNRKTMGSVVKFNSV